MCRLGPPDRNGDSPSGDFGPQVFPHARRTGATRRSPGRGDPSATDELCGCVSRTARGRRSGRARSQERRPQDDAMSAPLRGSPEGPSRWLAPHCFPSLDPPASARVSLALHPYCFGRRSRRLEPPPPPSWPIPSRERSRGVGMLADRARSPGGGHSPSCPYHQGDSWGQVQRVACRAAPDALPRSRSLRFHGSLVRIASRNRRR